MTYFSIIIYYTVVNMLPLILWFDSKNITYILSVPFFIISYLFGGYYFIGYAVDKYNIAVSSMEFYQNALLTSAISTSLTMCIGFYLRQNLISDIFKIFTLKVVPVSKKILNSKYIMPLSFISIILFSLSFYGMKFVPLFAESPLEAKFFSGPYQDLYKPYAIPYRLAIVFSQICLFFSIFRIFKLRKRLDILILFTLTIFLILTLRRGYIAFSLISFLMCYFSFYRKKFMLPVIVLYILIFAFGSASIGLVLFFSGATSSLDFNLILEGSPDIADQLVFVDRWISNNWDFTYGRSIIGGLVPFQYDFNPANISKLVVSNSKDIASGGFRLPVPILGYIAFGWYGIVFCSLVHGFFIGSGLRAYKSLISRSSGTFGEFIILYYLFDGLFNILNNIFSLNIDILLAFILTILFFILHKYRFTYS